MGAALAVVLARAEPEDVRVLRIDGDAAEREDAVVVEDRREGDAAVRRLPEAAERRRDVPDARVLRVDLDVDDAARGQRRTDAAKLEALAGGRSVIRSWPWRAPSPAVTRPIATRINRVLRVMSSAPGDGRRVGRTAFCHSGRYPCKWPAPRTFPGLWLALFRDSTTKESRITAGTLQGTLASSFLVAILQGRWSPGWFAAENAAPSAGFGPSAADDPGISVASARPYERSFHPRRGSPVRSARAALGLPCPGRLLRPQQGSVPRVRLQGAEDRPLRHLLLPGRRAGRPDGLADGGAVVHAAVPTAQPPAELPAAPHPLRQRVALPPDERRRGRDGGGHRRRHRGLQATDRAAVCRADRGERPRARARAGARVPVRHHRDQRQLGHPPGALALPLWFIEGMAEYLSVGPVDPLTAMWMREATRREQLPDGRQARQSEVLPVSLRPGALGLHRRQVRRRRRRQHAARRGRARRDLRARRSSRCCRSIRRR